MNLFLNSPSYYTQKYGIVDEIYRLCIHISQNIDIKDYTDCIDTIGIVPMIAPLDILHKTGWKEQKYVSLAYRMASISLISDYDSYCAGDLDEKKQIILNNILRSLKEVKKKLKAKFNYEQMEHDVKALAKAFDENN